MLQSSGSLAHYRAYTAPLRGFMLQSRSSDPFTYYRAYTAPLRGERSLHLFPVVRPDAKRPPISWG